MADVTDIDPIDQWVGLRLKRRRDQMDISQDELGKKIGLTFQQVQKYEKGANRISASTMLRIAVCLNITPDYFYEGLPEFDALKGAPAGDGMLQAFMHSNEGYLIARRFFEIKDYGWHQLVVKVVNLMADFRLENPPHQREEKL